MQFESAAAALAMDGHGIYVWSIVVVSVVISAGLLWLPSRAARRFLAEQRQLGGIEFAEEAVAPTARIEEVNNASGS